MALVRVLWAVLTLEVTATIWTLWVGDWEHAGIFVFIAFWIAMTLRMERRVRLREKRVVWPPFGDDNETPW